MAVAVIRFALLSFPQIGTSLKAPAKHSVFQFQVSNSAFGLHNEATNISSTITYKFQNQSQEFMPLNYTMIYDIMKELSLGNKGLRIIKSILIWKMLPKNKFILANGMNYHISTYFFHGFSANYTILVYWKMCLSKPVQTQGILSR